MAKKLPVERIKEVIDLALQNSDRLILQWFPEGKVQGQEYLTKNVKRGDQNIGSFKINFSSGYWADFAENGAKGRDLVHLHHWYFGTESQSESARMIADTLNMPLDGPVKKIKKAKASGWKNCTLFPPKAPTEEDFKNFYDKDENGWKTRMPVERYPFINEDESIAGYACRFEQEIEEVDEFGESHFTLKKDVQYLTWCKDQETGEEKYRYRHFAEKRPLLDRHHLKNKPNSIVLITEGEKCNKYVNTHLFGKLVGTSWSGGWKAVDKTDWSLVIGRRKVLWPDNDEAGFEAMLKVASKEPAKDNIRFFVPPIDKPKKWDVYDAGKEMEPSALKKMLEGGLVSYAEFSAIDIKARFGVVTVEEGAFDDTAVPYENFDTPPEQYEDIGDDFQRPEDQSLDGAIDKKWRALGYDRGIYFYYSFLTGQMIPLKPSQHDESNLLQFADLTWWETYYPSGKKPDYTGAKNFMMTACHKVGVFDDQKVRGCGAWLDDGRVVVHRGDHIVMDGKEIAIEDYHGKFIYEKDIAVQEKNSAPLTNAEASKFLDVCKKLNWEKPINAYYLTGWAVCAIIGGLLPWRPHAFVSGPAGSGKSWIMKLLKKILGREVVPLQGNTSEAGYRALSRNRSWPVWGDEIEAKTQAQQKRLDELLMLWRCASTDTDVGITKSTVDGRARSFVPRSCVCISAIGVNLSDFADVSRFSLLNLMKPAPTKEARDNFEKLEDEVAKLFTEEWCASFRSRIQGMALTIRKNSKVFSRAVGEFLGARHGDQIGTILAGAYALISSKEIDLVTARKWVEGQDWSEYSSYSSDEANCFSWLMDSHIKFENPKGGMLQRTVSELLWLCRPNIDTSRDDAEDDEFQITPKLALSVLKRYGIARTNETILISQSHKEVRSFLRNSPWAENYVHTLKRIDGSTSVKSVRFAGAVSRAIGIPAEYQFGGHEDE